MKVSFELGDQFKIIDTDPLEVVRLVASTRQLGTVDVEPFPTHTTIKAKGVTGRGESREEAALDFLRKAL